MIFDKISYYMTNRNNIQAKEITFLPKNVTQPF